MGSIFKNQKVLFWVFLFVLALPNLIMFFTESTSTFTRVCNVLFPVSCYWFALTLAKKPGKALWWMFIFSFFGAFEIVLLYLYGESPIAVDMFLNVVTTNVGEVDELLTNLLPAVIFVIVFYFAALGLGIYSIVNKETLNALFRLNQRKMALIAIIVTACMIGGNYLANSKFAIEDDIFPVNACYNMGLAIERTIKTSRYHKTSAHFTFNAVDTRSDSIPQVYVMVIGETARADNFGIYGYNRSTTPGLQHLQGLAVFRDAITMSNTTHKSVPLMLSAVGSEAYDSIYTQKSIITAFKEAGYHTVFYSNQRHNGSFIDFMGEEADECKFIKDKDIDANIPDDSLVTLFKQRMALYKGEKMLFVLHCYGSHFNYRDRYSRSEAYFKPDDVPSAERRFRPNLINAYDNTIREVDRLLCGVASELSLRCPVSAMIYSSDHGEDIFDDDRARFLHASPLPTYYQLRVPLLVWTSSGYRTKYPGKWRTLVGNTCKPVSTNRVVFHTLLDMAGIRANLLNNSDALGNAAFKPAKRLYVNDHCEYVPLDEAGLKAEDVEQFRRHGLQYP